jgi:hypothetical protein
MDEIVLQAMAKWPDVPAVYGWLALDRRGNWLLKGERIENPGIIRFIQRNYLHDERGCWFFQNGPQRVFVDLAYTPFIVRVSADGRLVTHTEQPVHAISGAWIDECGIFILATEHGPGIVDDRDVELLGAQMRDHRGQTPDEDGLIEALESLQRGDDAGLHIRLCGTAVPLQPLHSTRLASRLAFEQHPRPKPVADACT